MEEFPASLDDLNLNIVRLSYEVMRGMLIIFGMAWSLRNIQIIFFHVHEWSTLPYIMNKRVKKIFAHDRYFNTKRVYQIK